MVVITISQYIVTTSILKGFIYLVQYQMYASIQHMAFKILAPNDTIPSNSWVGPDILLI